MSPAADLATLDPRTRHLVERVLFDGETSAAIARSIGCAAGELRLEIAAAMLALRDGPSRVGGGSSDLDAMLVLRALDVLESDERERIDRLLERELALDERYARWLDLVADLCSGVAVDRPSPRTLERLRLAIDDDAHN